MTSEPSPFWALDSNNNELDPQLKAAQQQAEREHLARCDAGECKIDINEDEVHEPIILKNLLSVEQIDEILMKASADKVWPRGMDKEERTNREQAAQEPCEALKSKPHHLSWADGHIVLYMHNNDYWFVQELPRPWCSIRGAMETRPWMNGGIPELDIDFVGSEESLKRVRTIELHHYAAGGNLITPGHRDCGSELTISVLLSDPVVEYTGGDFVTYHEGVPIAHTMEKGDAILFPSEDLHNIASVTSGVRMSLVVELYPSKRY